LPFIGHGTFISGEEVPGESGLWKNQENLIKILKAFRSQKKVEVKLKNGK